MTADFAMRGHYKIFDSDLHSLIWMGLDSWVGSSEGLLAQCNNFLVVDEFVLQFSRGCRVRVPVDACNETEGSENKSKPLDPGSSRGGFNRA